MSLTQRKDRVVLFRLTEHEHQALEALCPARVGRSLSEFVGVEVLNPARSMDIAPLRELVGSMERRLLNPEGIDGGSARGLNLCAEISPSTAPAPRRLAKHEYGIESPALVRASGEIQTRTGRRDGVERKRI